MLLDFLRLMRGYVDFEIIGSFPERFLNITARNHIFVWNSKNDGVYTASMYISDYMKIRKYARKSKVRLKIIKKHGVPIYISKYKKRMGLIIGLLMFISIIYIMSCFVWTIDVSGIEKVSYSKLMSTLKENGVYIGTYIPKTDFPTASRNTMLEIEDIGWMSINATGSHLDIEVKEKAEVPELENRETVCNVKAKSDGVILNMEVYQGKTLITKGSGVVKGQLLVSGVMEDSFLHSTLVSANAKVLAKTKHEKSFSVSKIANAVFVNGKRNRARASIFSFEIPLSFSPSDVKNSVINTKTESAKMNGIFLPLSKIHENIYPLEITKIPISKNNAEKLLTKYSYLYETFSLCDAQVTNRNFEVSERKNSFSLSVSYDCIEDIAYREELKVDENADLSYHREDEKDN